ncbi:MAG: CAP domain-containing protein [Planctomycetota bacterium]|jgi:HEAT repeat protein
MLRPRVSLLALAILGLGTLLRSEEAIDVRGHRRLLRHAELLESLARRFDAAEDADARRTVGADLALVRLEAQLLQRVVPLDRLATQRPEALLPRLVALEKSAHEELVLARFAFLLGRTQPAEDALGRARDADPRLKKESDKVLAAARREPVPRGGYLRYRGLWLPLAERDYCQALDGALDALDAVEVGVSVTPFPLTDERPNRERFDRLGPGAGEAKLREAVDVIRRSLEKDYAEVRTWLLSYALRPKLRARLLAKRDAMRPVQQKALALIQRYDKTQQAEVDAFRDRLRGMHDEYRELVEQDLAPCRRVSVDEAWALHLRLRRREGALDAVDRFFLIAKLKRLAQGGATAARVLPGRRLSGLDDTLWLLVKHKAEQTLDVLDRGADLLRQRERLSAWELLVLETLLADAVDLCNERVATSLDPVERDFAAAVNAYRRTLGLPPFEVEERLNVCAKKHSQEMVDLGYFGHLSPIARNRTPTDRARLEGYGGGVGENCLSGRAHGRGAFEAWYHSPGHHRNLVGGGPHLGVGAVNRHSMWTMVAGGTDLTWRMLHRDLPPAYRRVLHGLTGRLAAASLKAPPSDALRATVRIEMPAVLPAIARLGFAAARDRRHAMHAAFPGVLGLLISADVGTPWRPLQVAAVAAAIEAMRLGGTPELRQQAFDLVRPHLRKAFAFDPRANDQAIARVVTDIRKHWEDTAQWRYRAHPDASPPVVPGIAGRGDGPSLNAARRVLSRHERLRLAKRFGGGTRTEQAVERGLAFLARVQDEDGAWRAKSFGLRLRDLKGDPGRGKAEFEIAMTGLALLAFSSAGYTTVQGEHADTVRKGAGFLAGRIIDYGKFETGASHYMYSHALGTQALCELYSYSADPHLGVAAQLAVDYLVYAQHQASGGWRYDANRRGDTSVTGWVLLALNSAHVAQLDVAGFRGALRFLESVTQPSYYHVGYVSPFDDASRGNRMTAVAMAGRLFLGAHERAPKVRLPAFRLREDLPRKEAIDFYYWYYATLALFQLGEPFWHAWNEALVPTLLDLQETREGSPLRGSWAPRGPWSASGGRIYQTSLGILMLTTYYRYDRAPKVRLHPFTGDLEKEVRPLLEALRQETDPLRSRVLLRRMVDRFGRSLVSPVARILRESEGDRGFRRQLAAALLEVAGPGHETLLVPLLGDPDREILESILRAIAHISSRESLRVLLDNLASDHKNVRLLCARSLGRLGDAEAIAALGRRLAVEKDKGVRRELEAALHCLGQRSGLTELLQEALPDEAVGYLAILDGLALLEQAGLVEHVLALKARRRKLHARALEAIRRHRESAAIPLLLVLMESPEGETRQRAVKLARAITRHRCGFDPEAAPRQREAALQKWHRWWKDAVRGFGR